MRVKQSLREKFLSLISRSISCVLLQYCLNYAPSFVNKERKSFKISCYSMDSQVSEAEFSVHQYMVVVFSN